MYRSDVPVERLVADEMRRRKRRERSHTPNRAAQPRRSPGPRPNPPVVVDTRATTGGTGGLLDDSDSEGDGAGVGAVLRDPVFQGEMRRERERRRRRRNTRPSVRFDLHPRVHTVPRAVAREGGGSSPPRRAARKAAALTAVAILDSTSSDSDGDGCGDTRGAKESHRRMTLAQRRAQRLGRPVVEVSDVGERAARPPPSSPPPPPPSIVEKGVRGAFSPNAGRVATVAAERRKASRAAVKAIKRSRREVLGTFAARGCAAASATPAARRGVPPPAVPQLRGGGGGGGGVSSNSDATGATSRRPRARLGRKAVRVWISDSSSSDESEAPTRSVRRPSKPTPVSRTANNSSTAAVLDDTGTEGDGCDVTKALRRRGRRHQDRPAPTPSFHTFLQQQRLAAREHRKSVVARRPRVVKSEARMQLSRAMSDSSDDSHAPRSPAQARVRRSSVVSGARTALGNGISDSDSDSDSSGRDPGATRVLTVDTWVTRLDNANRRGRQSSRPPDRLPPTPQRSVEVFSPGGKPVTPSSSRRIVVGGHAASPSRTPSSRSAPRTPLSPRSPGWGSTSRSPKADATPGGGGDDGALSTPQRFTKRTDAVAPASGNPSAEASEDQLRGRRAWYASRITRSHVYSSSDSDSDSDSPPPPRVTGSAVARRRVQPAVLAERLVVGGGEGSTDDEGPRRGLRREESLRMRVARVSQLSIGDSDDD